MLQQAARYISNLLFSSHINAYVKKKKSCSCWADSFFFFFPFIGVFTVECLHNRNIKQSSIIAKFAPGIFPLQLGQSVPPVIARQ